MSNSVYVSVVTGLPDIRLYLWLAGTGDSLREGKPWPPVRNGVLLLTPPCLSFGDTVSGMWWMLAVPGLDVLLFPVSPFHCWPRCVIPSSPLWSMPTFISSSFWMDLNKNDAPFSAEVTLYSYKCEKEYLYTTPAEKGLCEVLLGSILWLHPSLQQHLLIQLPLLLLLLQMLLHAETLSVILLYVLRGVATLDNHMDTMWNHVSTFVSPQQPQIFPAFQFYLFHSLVMPTASTHIPDYNRLDCWQFLNSQGLVLHHPPHKKFSRSSSYQKALQYILPHHISHTHRTIQSQATLLL